MVAQDDPSFVRRTAERRTRPIPESAPGWALVRSRDARPRAARVPARALAARRRAHLPTQEPGRLHGGRDAYTGAGTPTREPGVGVPPTVAGRTHWTACQCNSVTGCYAGCYAPKSSRVPRG